MDPKPTPDRDPLTPPPAVPPVPAWLRENGVNLLIGTAVIAAVLWYTNPLDVLLAALGLTFIIFIHELGHFAAAKLCGVRVETFSIGFGPALPFCSYRYGETTYKLAVVPLGGYVKMLGEGDGEGDEGAEDDPRSFKNQSVGERLFIITAGVVMNILLGCVLFVAVYMHGLEEQPAVASAVQPGGAAWRHGIRSGSEVKRIESRDNPWFDDLRPIVWSTDKGEQVAVEVEYRGKRETYSVEPLRDESAPFPALGILPPKSLTLAYSRRSDDPPYAPGSPAAGATAAGGGDAFKPGDRIVGMTDPDAPGGAVTPLPAEPDGYFAYAERLARLAGRPVTFEVVRRNEPDGAAPVRVVCPPGFRWDLGVRMQMGSIAAIRKDSPAAKAGLVAAADGGTVGDRIVAVELEAADGAKTAFRAGDPARPLDPVRLPFELNKWADAFPGGKPTTPARLTVLREDPGTHTAKEEVVPLGWDETYRYDLAAEGLPGSPTPASGLGLAYHVKVVVDSVAAGSPAAAAGLQPGDVVLAVRFTAADYKGATETGSWQDLKAHQWAFVANTVHAQHPHQCEVRVQRAGQTVEAKLTAAEDRTWPVDDRGLEFMPEFRPQRASNVGEALTMGAYRTARSIKTIYMNLYSMVFGRVSAVKTLSGPITLARASYFIAGEDPWRLLLFMALISINLAVVNFLPIPVLDGGHAMFLLYEWVRGKPAPEGVQNALTVVGLVMILCLMLFVIGLDVWRLFR